MVTSGPLAGQVLDFVQVHVLGTALPSWSYEGNPVWNAYPRFAPYQQTADPGDSDWADKPTSRSSVFDANH